MSSVCPDNLLQSGQAQSPMAGQKIKDEVLTHPSHATLISKARFTCFMGGEWRCDNFASLDNKDPHRREQRLCSRLSRRLQLRMTRFIRELSSLLVYLGVLIAILEKPQMTGKQPYTKSHHLRFRPLYSSYLFSSLFRVSSTFNHLFT